MSERPYESVLKSGSYCVLASNDRYSPVSLSYPLRFCGEGCPWGRFLRVGGPSSGIFRRHSWTNDPSPPRSAAGGDGAVGEGVGAAVAAVAAGRNLEDWRGLSIPQGLYKCSPTNLQAIRAC
ncbi:uncharacterized protein LOC121782073 [Salvia splendens]|uniref:uncharacterized protein LOC121782073 n=1 Tax=Salvia splendens TaxID=180675 RepID=UPI001C25A209|nr:uncharacterized protein LOC121782073 [Salvia splendens]